jgi:hypothetical protein
VWIDETDRRRKWAVVWIIAAEPFFELARDKSVQLNSLVQISDRCLQVRLTVLRIADNSDRFSTWTNKRRKRPAVEIRAPPESKAARMVGLALGGSFGRSPHGGSPRKSMIVDDLRNPLPSGSFRPRHRQLRNIAFPNQLLETLLYSYQNF